MRFIDLFAGLGGFHLALKKLGHECVFASEINGDLAGLYYKNFELRPEGDIRKVKVEEIPQHDILCAGFPCQPFSKAGSQDGFKCVAQGTLFYEIIRVLEYHRPQYVILENVANFKKHDNGNTYRIVEDELKKLGYSVDSQILSPHDYGVPQMRQRLFIVCGKDNLDGFQWPKKQISKSTDIDSILENNPSDAIPLPPRVQNYLNVWQEFLNETNGQDLPLPIWAMEFGADYPFELTTPFAIGFEELRRYKGSFGIPLADLSEDEVVKNLPNYSYQHKKSKVIKFPAWKVNFIKKNREFYAKNRIWIDSWLPKIQKFHQSFQKFEWNCYGEPRNISLYVVQLRASGIRVKRRKTISSLVGITTQVPIITWENRYMTTRERSKLQSMEELIFLPNKSPSQATEALGNAVNVHLVTKIAEALIV